MKFHIVSVVSVSPKWFEAASAELLEKINRFWKCELFKVKSEKLPRQQKDAKTSKETSKILNYIKPDDYVVLFDEQGKSMGSTELSKKVAQFAEKPGSRCLFVIGGAFGVGPELNKRANEIWKLSDLTLNHLMAQLVMMEQLYRGLTLWKGIPYHNE